MKVLITGNAGFIGSKVWPVLENLGIDVYGLDNLSRLISNKNLSLSSRVGNVQDINKDNFFDEKFDWVIHLAAQVSVIEGQSNPYQDYESNVKGTFEIVQWAKRSNTQIIFSSSNKVFGDLTDYRTPIKDTQPIMPRTNYGVSKASAAMYVQDYEYGWVLHQSCIYGPTQKGDEDQGWIGWINSSIKQGRQITCFGDGSQVRDILYVDDLVNLYLKIMDHEIPKGSYIVGGGEENAITFKNAVEFLGGKIANYADWRPSDQKYFVSDNTELRRRGWSPGVDWRTGLTIVKNFNQSNF